MPQDTSIILCRFILKKQRLFPGTGKIALFIPNDVSLQKRCKNKKISAILIYSRMKSQP